MWCFPSLTRDDLSEMNSVNTPLLASSSQKSFSRWTIAFILVTVAHLLLFGVYSGIDLYSLMTRVDSPGENYTSEDPRCDGITEIPINLALFYTAFSFFNFVLMASWVIAFWVNYKTFQITELGPSTQAQINRLRQTMKKINPYIMIWLYAILAVDSFGLAVDAYYFRCLQTIPWKLPQLYTDFVLVFVDYLSLVIYPILFSGYMTERPLRSLAEVVPEFRGLITNKVGLYLLLFVAHAAFYLAYWIVDLKILYEGFGTGDTDFYKSYVYFFTGLNCLNFWIIASWITTFVVGHFRGASIREALFENFAFFLLLLHYLLFTDAIAVALDAYQFNKIDSHRKFEFLVDFVLTTIDFLTIVFYPKILESFFPIVGHSD